MKNDYYPTPENPLVTMDNMKYVIKQSKTDFATKTEIAEKVDSTALETLATKAELANYVPTTTLETLATKTELASYATTEALNGKADTATVTALEGRIAAIETEITGVATSLASLIGG